jgi:hypothetical protein
MARDKKPVQPVYMAAEQEEMTVVVVKFKGGPESMQKGFDAVNNAISALGPAHPNSPRVVVTRTPARSRPHRRKMVTSSTPRSRSPKTPVPARKPPPIRPQSQRLQPQRRSRARATRS